MARVTMRTRQLHRWDVTPAEAVEIQRSLRDKVSLSDTRKPPRLVCGVDVAFDKAGGRTFAAAVVVRMESLEEVERRTVTAPLSFPYVPGLLTFREGPAVAAVIEALHAEPDLLIFDGQGYAHPRRMGLATHMGLLVDCPTIGCAKSLLVGEFEEPDVRAGASSPISHKGEVVGAALRTRTNVKPVFVSPGNRISLERAVEITLSCTDGLRIPKPTREAHRAVGEWKAREIARP